MDFTPLGHTYTGLELSVLSSILFQYRGPGGLPPTLIWKKDDILYGVARHLSSTNALVSFLEMLVDPRLLTSIIPVYERSAVYFKRLGFTAALNMC